MRLLLLFLCAAPALFAQVDFSASHLPILVIEPVDTIRDEPKVTAFMGLIDNASGDNQLTDAYNGYEGQIGIELRGSTSQQWPKKPYGFETRNADGSNRNVSLLGMPEENDWILYPSYFDRTLLRNVLTYRLGNRLLPYAPRTRFVELVVDGDYRGIYILTEKIKRDANRVDIAKLTPDDNSGDDLTGGYLLKFDKGVDETNSFATNEPQLPPDVYKNNFVQFVYPKPADISPTQRAYIETAYHGLEAAFAGPDFADPTAGYAPLVDVASFVDFFLLNEVARNLDGYRISTFFYKEKDSRGGRWHMGPLWDFNFAYGSAFYCDGSETSGWAYQFNDVCPDDYYAVPFFWARLRADPTFNERLRDRYHSLRAGVLHTDSLHQYLDAQAAYLGDAIGRNRVRWPGTEGWFPATYVGDSYTDDHDWLKAWLADRLAWLDGELQPLDTSRPTAAAGFRLSSNAATESLLVILPTERPQAPLLVIYDTLGRERGRYVLAAQDRIRLPLDLGTGTYTGQLLDGDRVVARQTFVRY